MTERVQTERKWMKKIGNILSGILIVGCVGCVLFLPEYGPHVLSYFIAKNIALFISCCAIGIATIWGIYKKFTNFVSTGGLNEDYFGHLLEIISLYIGISVSIIFIIYGIVRISFYYISINNNVTVGIIIFCVLFVIIGLLIWLFLFPITKKLDEKYGIPMRLNCVVVLAILMLIFGAIMSAHNLIKAQKDVLCGRQSEIIYNCYYSSSHSRHKGTTYDLIGNCRDHHVRFDITGIGESTLEKMEGKNVRISYYPNTQCVYSAELVE